MEPSSTGSLKPTHKYTVFSALFPAGLVSESITTRFSSGKTVVSRAKARSLACSRVQPGSSYTFADARYTGWPRAWARGISSASSP